MRRIAILVLALLVFQVGSVWAGEQVKVSCANPRCLYTTDLALGGGMHSPALTGYCSKCRNFARVKLDNWSQYRGQVYPCPHCRTPLAPIYTKEQISNFPCPRCGELTLKARRTLLFD